MKLYFAPGTCALACWIALDWTGADYVAEKVNYASEEFRRINPLAQVPALDIGWPRALTQADAILQYVAARFPDARLGPDAGIDAEAEFNETLAFLTGDFHPAFWPFFAPKRFTTLTDEASLKAAKDASNARVDRVMSYLDTLIGDRDHVYRNRRTVADPYAYIMAGWTKFYPKTFAEYPNVARFMARMDKDASVQKVLAAQKG